MLFNSLDFAIFLPIVWVLYWSISKFELKYQNLLIVGASYLFYGWWDWRFLLLIFFSTFVDYFTGLSLHKAKTKIVRKRLLWVSISVNLGLLGFFKYYNFFVESFVDAFSFFGMQMSTGSLNIILPVGISFYTFQTLSYTIDIYRNKLEPTKDFVAFTAFVSFFPQLVAGPIERATNLLPQFFAKRKFDYHQAIDGFQQILWGLFKKVVIAENCAEYVNMIYSSSEAHSGSSLFLATSLFTLQLYGDFSGYSDIAIGTGRLFGFELRKNFAFPFFSRSLPEFWRRWHISLMTWLVSYVGIPLNRIGKGKGKAKKIRNMSIILLVSGLWHGANWTFILWGVFHAVCYIPYLIWNRQNLYQNTVAAGRLFPSVKELFQMSGTVLVLMFSCVFFRAIDVGQAFSIFSRMFSSSLWTIPVEVSWKVVGLVSVFMLIEWFGRESEYGTQWVAKLKYWLGRVIITILISLGIVLFMATDQTDFLYFQF